MLARLSYALVAVFLVLVVLCWWVIFAYAEDFRLAAFGLHCEPQTGSRVVASITGTIWGSGGRRPIRFQGTCVDGPTASTYPPVRWSHGTILRMEVAVSVWLWDTQGNLLAENRCEHTSHNGLLFFRCQADEELGGRVSTLVSIAKEQP